jgi:hypothetical protein
MLCVPEVDAAPKLTTGIALYPTRIDWATLLKRTYDLDALSCPCGGRLKLVLLVTDAGRAKELLEQFGMSTKPPPITRARSSDWDYALLRVRAGRRPSVDRSRGGRAPLWNRARDPELIPSLKKCRSWRGRSVASWRLDPLS